jgi:hypothetical protein
VGVVLVFLLAIAKEASGATAAVGGHRRPARLILSVLSFAIAAGIVVVGLYVMVTSK